MPSKKTHQRPGPQANRPPFTWTRSIDDPAVNPPPAEMLNAEILKELKAIREENARLREEQADQRTKRKHARVQLPPVNPVSISRGIASKSMGRDPGQSDRAHLLPSRQLPADSYLG